MRLYLDDDSARGLLIKLLIQSGHDVETLAQVGLAGVTDPEHLAYSISADRVLLSGNHHDFLVLHRLVLQSAGHHPGIIIVRRDNDLSRDLSPRGIVNALRNFIDSGTSISDQVVILNHWR